MTKKFENKNPKNFCENILFNKEKKYILKNTLKSLNFRNFFKISM